MTSATLFFCYYLLYFIPDFNHLRIVRTKSVMYQMLMYNRLIYKIHIFTIIIDTDVTFIVSKIFYVVDI